MSTKRQRNDTLDMAYFFIDNSQYAAYIPLNMIASLHTVAGEDEYTDVVVTTITGKEFITQGFEDLTSAMNFCEEQMQEISDYNRALAEAHITSKIKEQEVI